MHWHHSVSKHVFEVIPVISVYPAWSASCMSQVRLPGSFWILGKCPISRSECLLGEGEGGWGLFVFDCFVVWDKTSTLEMCSSLFCLDPSSKSWPSFWFQFSMNYHLLCHLVLSEWCCRWCERKDVTLILQLPFLMSCCSSHWAKIQLRAVHWTLLCTG